MEKTRKTDSLIKRRLLFKYDEPPNSYWVFEFTQKEWAFLDELADFYTGGDMESLFQIMRKCANYPRAFYRMVNEIQSQSWDQKPAQLHLVP